jgi:hypothetical protein
MSGSTLAWPALLALTVLAFGCSNTGAASAAVSVDGGSVDGPADTHCQAVPSQATNENDCNVTTLPDGGSGSGLAYGATMFNAQGDDDQCKYHLSWSSTPILENENVAFTFSATYKSAGAPNPPACSGCPVEGLTTQNALVEAFLSGTHPAPNTSQAVTPGAAGTYSIGPIQFDAPGRWTVRFHLFETCADVAADSPAGHAAFYVDVP